MGPLGAKVSKLESLKSPLTTKVERGLIRISSFSWLSRSAISTGISIVKVIARESQVSSFESNHQKINS